MAEASGTNAESEEFSFDSQTTEYKGDNTSKKSANDTQVDSRRKKHQLPFQELGGFRINAEIGRGGMGVVYQATELKLGREVAVKILPATGGLSGIQVERFLMEARAAAKLNHDHIVPVYRIGEDQGTKFFAMKLIVGNDLASVISSARLAIQSRRELRAGYKLGSESTVTVSDSSTNERSSDDRILSGDSIASGLTHSHAKATIKVAKSVARVGMQIADALSHAHLRGVIHRDIKPSNLLLDEDQKAWVTDFGLAQLQNAPALTNTGDIIGTLRYMSPEQASGRRAFVDNRTDIYSLGITLYELSTLKAACRGKTTRDILREITFERPIPVRKINPKLPADFETIISKATERNPDDRYQTARELAEDLDRFLKGQPVCARPPSKLKRTIDWFYQRPAAFASSAIAAVLLVLSLASVSIYQTKLKNAAEENSEQLAQALTETDRQRIIAIANLLRASNPGLALALAIQATQGSEAPTANQTFLEALDQHHELKTVFLNESKTGTLRLQSDGRYILKCADGRFFDSNVPAEIYDGKSGDLVSTLNADETATTGIVDPGGSFVVTAGSNFRYVGPRTSLQDLELARVRVWSGGDFSDSVRIPDTFAIHLGNGNLDVPNRRIVLPKQGNVATVLSTETWTEIGPTLRGHTAPIVDVVWSHAGDALATWSEDGTLRVWNADSGAESAQISIACQRPLNQRLEFSNNDEFLLMHGDGIQLVKATDLKTITTLEGDMATFSENGDWIYYAQRFGGAVFAYHTGMQRNVFEFPMPDTSSFVASFSLVDSDRVLAIAAGSDILLFDTSSGQHLSTCRGHEDFVHELAGPLSQSDQFCSVSWDGTLRFWSVQSDADRRSIRSKYSTLGPRMVSFSADGERALLSTLSVHTTNVLNAKSFQVQQQVPGQFLAKLPGGAWLTHNQKRLMIWSQNNVLQYERELGVGQEPAEALAIPESEQVFFTTINGELLEWNLETNELIRRNAINENVTVAKVRPGSNELWIGCADGKLQRMENNALQVITQFSGGITPFSKALSSIEFSSDARLLLATTADGEFILWDLEAQEIRLRQATDDFPIMFATFARPDRILTHAGAQTTQVGLWDAESGELLDALELDHVSEIAVSPNQDSLAIAALKNGAYVWDLVSSRKPQVTTRTCGGVKYSADGRVLFSTDTPFTGPSPYSPATSEPLEPPALLVWDIATQELTDVPLADINVVDFCEVADQLLISGLTYGCEEVDIDSGQRKHIFVGHSGALVLAEYGVNNSVVTVSAVGSIQQHFPQQDEQKELALHEFAITTAVVTHDKAHLVTTDRSRTTRKTNIATGVSEEIEIPFGNSPGRIQHAAGPDNHRMLSCDGTDTIYLWDLRSNGTETLTIPNGVFDIIFAPQGDSALLLVGRQRPTVPPSRIFDVEPGLPNAAANAILLDVTNSQTREIHLDGEALDARFVDGGQTIAFLTTEGSIDFLDVDSLDRVASLARKFRYQAFLGPSNGDQLFAATHKRIAGFSVMDKKLRWDIPAKLDAFQWSLLPRNGDWMVVPQQNSLRRVPTDFRSYLSRVSTRPLTDAEKQEFLNQTHLPAD